MSLRITFQIILLLCLANFSGKAQTVDTVWLNTKWEKSTKAESFYHRTIQKSADLKTYLVNDYYNTGELQMAGTYLSLNPEVRDGQFRWWYKNGQKRAETLYKDQDVIKEIQWDTEGKITVQRELVNTIDVVDGERVNSKAYLDIAPDFEGGMDAVHKFINENFILPRSLEETNPHGKIIISFVINSKGKVVDIRVDQGLNALLDKEVVRVVRSMPNWKPGIQDGKPVSIRMSLPLNF
jgi:antitoxin component YwqK of YwqJK toxin-antitoxin module